jgi:predicted nucleotide-binding protein
MSEAKAAVGKKYLDPRKISAYIAWNFITKDGERLKLTERGREYSGASKEKQKEIFQNIIRENRAYNIATEWIYHQKFDQVTNIDIASHLHEHCKDELGTDNEQTIRLQVICCFNIAEAAGLGSLTLGRKGQPTRFSVDKDELSNFISETSFEKPKVKTTVHEEYIEDEDLDKSEIKESISEHDIPEKEITKEMKPPKVFITHGKNMEIVDQIKTMLELANLEYEVAVEEESTAIPVPEKVFTAMRNCNSAIICVTADDDNKNDDGTFSINQNVLIEIGAAFVLYDKKVVLVWDKRIPVPSNLQGLYRCEFEGNELSWSAGMKLMKAVNKFKQ